MPLEEIRALVRTDLAAVDAMIRARLKSAVPLVDQVAEHIIGGGGKRLRPLLCVLAGRACGIESEKHIEAAAFIEFVHTATLLHDDVVDGSQKRRGRATANNIFGNQASVLVGDFVYSRAFQMMATVGSQRVMEIMADATNVIAEGEVLQLMNAHDPETTEQRYLEVIYRKTGRLFEAGAEVAAVLAGAPVAQQAALATLRQTSRHRLSTHRRRARLQIGPGDARQESRRRSGRRQADTAVAARAAPRQRRATRPDSPRHRTGRARAAGPDRRSHRNHRRPRLRDRASRSAKPRRRSTRSKRCPTRRIRARSPRSRASRRNARAELHSCGLAT